MLKVKRRFSVLFEKLVDLTITVDEAAEILGLFDLIMENIIFY